MVLIMIVNNYDYDVTYDFEISFKKSRDPYVHEIFLSQANQTIGFWKAGLIIQCVQIKAPVFKHRL